MRLGRGIDMVYWNRPPQRATIRAGVRCLLHCEARMFRLVVLALLALFLLSAIVALVVTLLVAVATLAAICLPIYFLARYWLNGRTLSSIKQSSFDRLQNLYVEGKIDMFEFERRVAHLIAVEH
jgi:hypothetical protein